MSTRQPRSFYVYSVVFKRRGSYEIWLAANVLGLARRAADRRCQRYARRAPGAVDFGRWHEARGHYRSAAARSESPQFARLHGGWRVCHGSAWRVADIDLPKSYHAAD